MKQCRTANRLFRGGIAAGKTPTIGTVRPAPAGESGRSALPGKYC